jgi:hypothetical protein
MTRHGRELAAALTAAAVARVIVLAFLLTDAWGSDFVSHMVQDLRTWHDFFVNARAGYVPYVDFSKEYPVLTGALYWALAPFVRPSDLWRTVLVHGLVMGVVDLVNTGLFFSLLRAKAPDRALGLTLLFSLNPTVLLLSPLRFESVLVLFVLVGYRAHARGRPLHAVAWWSVGFWLKWVPAFFIAAQEWRALVVERRRWQWLAALGIFGTVALAVNFPFALMARLTGGSLAPLTAPWRFHVVRPLYWDTLLGVGQIWLGPLPWERYGSFWTLGLVVLALALRPSLRLEYKGVLLCLAAIVFNRIYSAQFNLWFYPFLLLGLAEEKGRRFARILALAVALDLLNVVVFPLSFTLGLAEMGGFGPYAAVLGGGPWTVVFSVAIVARAVLLVVLAVGLLIGPGADGMMPRS